MFPPSPTCRCNHCCRVLIYLDSSALNLENVNIWCKQLYLTYSAVQKERATMQATAHAASACHRMLTSHIYGETAVGRFVVTADRDRALVRVNMTMKRDVNLVALK